MPTTTRYYIIDDDETGMATAHSSDDCERATGPGGWVDGEPDAWLCGRCVEVKTRPAPTRRAAVGHVDDVSDFLEDDGPAETPKRSTKRPTVKPYTWAKRGDVWCVRVPVQRHEAGDKVEIAKRDGSKAEAVLGELVETGDPFDYWTAAKAEATTETGTPVGRWSRDSGGDWSVALAPELGVVGDEIIVRKANGEEQTIVLGDRIETKGDSVLWAVGAPASSSAAAEAPDGLHAIERDGVVEVYKVQRSESTGRAYAKRLVGTTFDYVGRGPLDELDETTILTAEMAARYGQAVGVCCVCARTLTDPASIAAGIGPVCAGKF